jgi:muramidase (phage lysozyme)
MADDYGSDALSAIPGIDDTQGVRRLRTNPLLGAVPELTPANPPKSKVNLDSTDPNKDSRRDLLPGVKTAPDTLDRLPTSSPQTGGFYEGPITPTLAEKAGFSPEEASDWASLGNYLTRGESVRNASAFTEVYGSGQWGGGLKNHPYQEGWSGGIGPDGRPTSAAGVFQDEQGTWQGITTKYLNGDTSFTPVNQVKGNLLMAADLYKQRTGRNILADYKAGKVATINSVLSDQWPSLTTDRNNREVGDSAYKQYLAQTKEDIDGQQGQLNHLIEMARKSDPFSEEMRIHLHDAIQRSEALSKKYETLSATPPKSQTPMEAGSAIMPLLILFSALGGFATRHPAMGAANALAGALQGLNEGNDKQYSNNVELWKTQVGFAQKAFEMQNSTIRNIMDDQELTEREKQNELTNAFRFWQMDNDLKLARENMWKEIYERQDQREDKTLERNLLVARTNEALERAKRESEEFRMGGEDLTGNTRSLYESNYKIFVEKNGREPTEEERYQMKIDAQQAGRQAKGALTSAQTTKNNSIQADRDYFGFKSSTDMDAFDDDVNAAQGNQSAILSDDALKKKGYNPRQVALYKAEISPTIDPTKNAQSAALVKRYANARNQLFAAPTVTLGEQAQTATPTGQAGGRPEATTEQLQGFVADAKEKGASREDTKQTFLQYGAALGLSESDFNALWPETNTPTPTGPVAPQDQQFDYPGALGLAPGF